MAHGTPSIAHLHMLCAQAKGDITAIAKALTPWLEPMLEQPDTLPPLAQALLDHIATSADRSALTAFPQLCVHVMVA